MFSASQLSPEQIARLKELAAQGGTLSDLQRHLKEEESLSITYMDTRFLVLDLGIELQEEKKDAQKDQVIGPEAATKEEPQATGGVSVSMDTITLPGAMISGKVTFRDGETAIWMIDQSGRPGIDPDTPGYRPTQEDIAEFQIQLRSLLESQQGGL